MAFVLDLVYGATTINLSSNGIRLLNYVPRAEAKDALYVTEPAEIEISGASVTAMQTLIQSINNAFRRALEYSQSGVGDRVFLKYTPDGYASAYRSEIVARPGEQEAARMDLAEHAQNLSPWSTQHRIHATLTWNRRNFWEADTETQVPISNSNGLNDTAGLNVFNCNDGTGVSPNIKNNYFDVAAASVVGDLPGATRIEGAMYNDIRKAGYFHFYNNVLANPASLVYWLDAAGSADVNCSGGQYESQSIPAAYAAGGVFAFARTDPQIQAFAGAYCKFLAQLRSATSSTEVYRVRGYTGSAGGRVYGPTIYWKPSSTTDYEFLDLGLIRIPALPPSLLTGLTFSNPTIGIELRAGAAQTVYCDYFQVAPVDFAAIVFQNNQNAVWASPQTLVLDEINHTVAFTTMAGGIYSFGVCTGSGIYLMPGKDQRIVFLSSLQDITGYMTTKLFYRPRRLIL